MKISKKPVLVVAKIGTKYDYSSLLILVFCCEYKYARNLNNASGSLQFITAVDYFSEMTGFEIIITRIQREAFAAFLFIRLKKLISF